MIRCLAVLAASFIVWSFGGSAVADEEKVVNVYNWTDYITDEALEDFEKEFGIKVNYDTYDNSQIVDAKLLAGHSGYDVVVHSSKSVARLAPLGLLLPLDKSKLPNWKNLNKDILKRLSSRDPGNAYAAPYMWGTVGFAYNVDMVNKRLPHAPLNSYAMMFDPTLMSKLADCGVSFLDSPEDVIPMALAYSGRDPNSLAEEDLVYAEKTLKAVRPYIKYFDSSRLIQDLPGKEVCMAGSWSGDYAQAANRALESGIKVHLAYTTPIEGSPIWFDLSVIPIDARHPDNAHKFLNYLMRPEVIAAISEEVQYANANDASLPYLPEELKNDPAIYPPKEVLDHTYLTPVPTMKEERRATRLWARIKSGL